jgi:hypothetical protein
MSSRSKKSKTRNSTASLARLFKTPQSSDTSKVDFITKFRDININLGSLSAENRLAYSEKNIVDSLSWLVVTFKVLMGEHDFRDSVFRNFTGDRHQSIYLGNDLVGGIRLKGVPLRKSLDTFGKKIAAVNQIIYFTLVDQAEIGAPSHYVGNVYNPNAPPVDDGDETEKVIFVLDPAQGKNGKYPFFGNGAEEKYADEVLPAAASQNSFLEVAVNSGVSWELVPKAAAPQLLWDDPPGGRASRQRGDTFCQTWSMMLMISFHEGIEPAISKYTNIMKGNILSNFYKYIFQNIIQQHNQYMDMLLRNYYMGKYNTPNPNEKEIEASREEVMYLLHQLTPERFVRSQSWGKGV